MIALEDWAKIMPGSSGIQDTNMQIWEVLEPCGFCNGFFLLRKPDGHATLKAGWSLKGIVGRSGMLIPELNGKTVEIVPL
ncbi:MAG: hypothetical protein V1848_02280 [Candidatus Magasanikbacteria bacterium]